jgi:hypothetical protein
METWMRFMSLRYLRWANVASCCCGSASGSASAAPRWAGAWPWCETRAVNNLSTTSPKEHANIPAVMRDLQRQRRCPPTLRSAVPPAVVALPGSAALKGRLIVDRDAHVGPFEAVICT